MPGIVQAQVPHPVRPRVITANASAGRTVTRHDRPDRTDGRAPARAGKSKAKGMPRRRFANPDHASGGAAYCLKHNQRLMPTSVQNGLSSATPMSTPLNGGAPPPCPL